MKDVLIYLFYAWFAISFTLIWLGIILEKMMPQIYRKIKVFFTRFKTIGRMEYYDDEFKTHAFKNYCDLWHKMRKKFNNTQKRT